MTSFTEVFSVKIYEKLLDVDLSQLKAICLKHEADHIAKTNVRLSRAWDKYNVFDWPEPIIERLSREIMAGINEYLAAVPLPRSPKGMWLDGWVNINRLAEFHATHVHLNSVLSVLLYVQVPKFDLEDTNFGSEPFGATRFDVERWACDNPLWKNDTWVEPVAGKLVIWPSNLPHYAAPNKSEEPRITISANVMF